MSIQVFPQPSSGYLQFGGYISQNKYGTPSNTDNRVEFDVSKPLDAGTYLINVKIAASGFDGMEVGGVGRDFVDGDNIVAWATGATTYKYYTRGRWGESISFRNLTTKTGGIAYGNGFYVIAGQGTTSGCVSTNGANWATSLSIQSAPESNERAVSFANGYFIVNGPQNNGTNIMISTNGTTWTSRLVATSVSPKGRWAYSTVQGLYFNFYLNGAIVISSDLVTFTTRAVFAGTGDGVNSNVFYANPWWVKSGGSGSLCISTNGTTWTTRDPVPGFSQGYGAYGNNRFVSALSGTNTMVVSTDFTNWTTSALPWSSATNANDLIFANGYFVASYVGLNSNTYSGIFTSTNGTNWVARWVGSNNEPKFLAWGTTGGYVAISGNTGIPSGIRSLDVAGGAPATIRFFGYGGRNDVLDI